MSAPQEPRQTDETAEPAATEPAATGPAGSPGAAPTELPASAGEPAPGSVSRQAADEPGGPVVGEDGKARTPWAYGHSLLLDYYDTEWGLPVTSETGMFERLSLEGFQAGLSWLTILRKRPRFREVFAGFDVDAVAEFGSGDVARLLEDPGIIRHRGKIEACLRNARATIALRDGGGLVAFIESFAPETTPQPRTMTEVPTVSAESTALSKALKKRGFAFVGPTTMYALFEAVGIVDTHLLGSHRRGVSGRWPA